MCFVWVVCVVAVCTKSSPLKDTASAEGDLQMYMAKKYVTAEQKAVLQQLIIDFFANVPGANAPEKLGKWLQARQCPASGVVSKDVNRHILSMGYVH